MNYGNNFTQEQNIEYILQEDDPGQEILILRKKLLRYTKSMTDTDRSKYEKDLYFIKLKEDKMKGRNKTVGKKYLQEQKRKEVAMLKDREEQNRKR